METAMANKQENVIFRMNGRERSLSEPSRNVYCGNYFRDRSRKTDLDYERGKDRLAHWIGSWGYEEICAVLYCLIPRCRMNQMEYLWTAMESVPHRDFLYTATSSSSNLPRGWTGSTGMSSEQGVYFPLSTPTSRELSSKLKKSRRIENRRLYRVASIVDVCDGFLQCFQRPWMDDLNWLDSSLPVGRTESRILLRPTTEETSLSYKLPDLQASSSKVRACWTPSTVFHPTPVQPTTNSNPLTPSQLLPSHHSPLCPSRQLDLSEPVTLSCHIPDKSRASPSILRFGTPRPVSSRILIPMRRHMAMPSPPNKSLPTTQFTSYSRTPNHCTEDTQSTRTRQTCCVDICPNFPLPPEGLECLVWFSDLHADWQQQEVLQLVVSNLDKKELYFLSIVLMSRQYRDIVTKLSETLAIKILSYVPAKELLSHCCQVSQSWNRVCSNQLLWEMKAHQSRMCLTMRDGTSWKQLFLDDLKLKKNWARGRYVVRELTGHTRRVLAVCLKDSFVVSGSSDCTVRVWSLITNECLSTLRGHSKAVWCVCFYGKNLVISGARDGLIKIWNYRTGACARTLKFHRETVWAIQQKRELLVSGAHDKMVWACLTLLKVTRMPVCLATEGWGGKGRKCMDFVCP